MKLLTTSLLVLGLLASCGRDRSNNSNVNPNVYNATAANQWYQNCQNGFNNYQFGNMYGNPYAYGTGFNFYLGYGMPYTYGNYGMNPFNAPCR